MFSYCPLVYFLYALQIAQTSQNHDDNCIFYAAKIPIVLPFRFKHFKYIFQFFPPHAFILPFYQLFIYRIQKLISVRNNPGIPHYNDCNTLSRQSSRLLHRCCLWRSGIFFAFMISEKSTCLRIFKTIFRKTLKFAAALSFRTRQ